MVSIPGGEPLLHPQIKEIVEGLVQRKKYVYLCTNALLLEKKIDLENSPPANISRSPSTSTASRGNTMTFPSAGRAPTKPPSPA